MCINPVFNDSLGSDEDALANDLANGLVTWSQSGNQLTVKLYDVQGSQPVYPAATVTKNPGVFTEPDKPREVALCLSFYSGHPEPSKRGRLYLPCAFVAPASPIGVRPTTGMIDRAEALVPVLTGLGGVDVDWGVWSEKLHQFFPTSYWWVDNEWDTQRRRGLKATTRDFGTVSE
jgi:hypothetical protein